MKSKAFIKVKRSFKKDQKYVVLVLLHITFGFIVFQFPSFRLFLFLGIILFFLIRIICTKQSQKTITVLLACCYMVGMETFLRMTTGDFFYEISKYLVILFLLIGMFYKGLSGNGYPYFIYLVLLVPAIVVASIHLDFETNFRTSIAFVLSGPMVLGISALFCYDKKIQLSEMLKLLVYVSLPIISMSTYLYLYNPSVREVLIGTASNFVTSGGFGPNQVSSVLGLGMFAMTVRFFLKSPTLFLKILNLSLLGFMSYRALMTFSRGGVYTALLAILTFLVAVYWKSRLKKRRQILVGLVLFVVSSVMIWTWSKRNTSGLIEMRYANEDASGRKKESTSGRVDLFIEEFSKFKAHPFLGVGASGMKQERIESQGFVITSHSEIGRLLSEHGLFGIIIIGILILRPFMARASSSKHVFFYAFLVFWFATINHSGMRIAAPGFIYALALIHVTHDKTTLHRKSLARRDS